MITLTHFLVVSACIFCIGLYAVLAKKNAIVAYLEAKNIKKTYMLESLIDSDSDFDAEIDEVSESELEDL